MVTLFPCRRAYKRYFDLPKYKLSRIKEHFLSIYGLEGRAPFQPFYDLLSLFVSIIGQMITRNSSSGEEVGHMAIARLDPVIMASSFLQMTQMERVYSCTQKRLQDRPIRS